MIKCNKDCNECNSLNINIEIDDKGYPWENKCLLKKFGILEINEIVPYRNHPNPNLLYVFFDHDWHTAERGDVDIISKKKEISYEQTGLN